MKIVFYYDTRSLNDATSHYIKLIEQSALKLGIKMYYTSKLQNVKTKDVILTITAKYYVQAKLSLPFHKTIFWAQGVAPEEYLMSGGGGFKYKVKEFMERIAVKSCNLLFVVSDKMLYHYKNKYNYKGDNYLVMPCYNLEFNPQLISRTLERYTYPSFVYAGSMSTWQCIEETLELFGKVQDRKPHATLTLLVKEKEKAYKLIDKYNLKNVVVKYVALDKLQNELLNYKYGFLIREDNIVNNVATPTKMNSYLASGIIPIFTDAVDSFVENIDLGKDNTICLASNDSIEFKSNIIINHLSINTNVTDLIDRINLIFKIYYNDEKYINIIIDKLKIYLL